MTDYYVGLMSGTSMDGIDAVVAGFGESSVDILATYSYPYPAPLRDALLDAAREPLGVELDPTGDLHKRVGECFRDAALKVIGDSGVTRDDIVAIGSHGQTLRHQPNAETPFSLQIGDAAIIAAGCKVTTVANFRAADMAAGGQGAPLVPPFHQHLFASDDGDRVVANIGGIANITTLPADGTDVIGFDTGPGNGLMDAWIRHQLGHPFDDAGTWAASGNVVESLLKQFLRDSYFELPAPKSTGFEYFNLRWLRAFDINELHAVDVQATLCELSARTIADSVQDYCFKAKKLFVCGGGLKNLELMRRLQRNLAVATVHSTAEVGLDPDWVEAVAFAWMARRTIAGLPSNLPSVTGASHAVILGELHYP